MKKKKNNKNIFIILGFVLIIILGILSYNLFFKSNNNYSYSEKKWISDNNNKVIDLFVNNELPIFSFAGTGVYYDFITALEKDTGLTFNTVTSSINYKFDLTLEKKENDLVFYEDHFVVISDDSKIVVDSFEELKGKKIGILSTDASYIKYYLSNAGALNYITYENFDNIEASLNDGIDIAIIPLYKYINKIVSQNYNVLYHFSDLEVYYSLALSDKDKELNSIITKFFRKWDYNLSKTVNGNLMNVYYEAAGTSELNKQTLKSKDYIVGYVENLPFEGSIRMKFTGITNTYLDKFSDLTGVSFTYNEYRNQESLESSLNSSAVDITYNYKNMTSSEYVNSYNLNKIDYVILSHSSNVLPIESIYGLKGITVKMEKKTALTENLRSKNIFTIEEISEAKNLVKNLKEEDILILEREVYEYYKNKLENFSVRFESKINANYNFLLYKNNNAFNDVFNFFLKITPASYILNTAISQTKIDALGSGIIGFISEQRAYFISGTLVLIYVIYKLMKKKKQVNRIKKEDKLIYRDKLTNLKNRNYLNDNIDIWDSNKIYPQAVITIDLNQIKYINDTAGHEEGDRQIQAAANILIKNQRENTEIIRTDGNEFLIYLVGYDEKIVTTYMNRLSKEFKKLPYNYGAASGYSMITSEIKTIDDAINDSLVMMRQSKSESGDKTEQN